MSYILDALKKAERERGIAQVPSVMTVHDTQPAASRKNFWLISGACLVCAAVLVGAGLLLKTTIRSGRHNAQAVTRARESSPVATTPVSTPKAITPPENSIARAASPVSAKPSLAQSAPVKRPAADENRITVPGQILKRVEPLPVAREPIQTQAVSKTLPVKTEGTGTPEGSQSKPMSLREAIAKMNMTVLMYSEVPSERMVFINDHKYVEGDYIDGRYLLETITLEGAVLSYQGERATLRSKAK